MSKGKCPSCGHEVDELPAPERIQEGPREGLTHGHSDMSKHTCPVCGETHWNQGWVTEGVEMTKGPNWGDN